MQYAHHNYALKSFWRFVKNPHAWTAVALWLTASWVQAQTYISDGADFNAAITGTNSVMNFYPSGEVETAANTTTGSAGTVTYNYFFPGVISFSTSIEGNNSTLSGFGEATPLFLASPLNETATGGVTSGATTYTISVSNLTISVGDSHGGNGANGGAGLGGGMFVGTGYQVTLNNVTITNNSATGGDANVDDIHQAQAGGGGIGGNGNSGGGGLFANAPTSGGGGGTGTGGGANGGVYAAATDGMAGGFGGGGGVSGDLGVGGDGGFGGGGADAGGNGGFGGGGGTPYTPTSGDGNGGFGGGGQTGGFGGISYSALSDTSSSGGAGAGFGGGIFVQNGANVLVTGNSSISGNSVAGGTTLNDPDDGNPQGAAAGADIFMMSGSSVTLAPGAGNTITIGQASDNAAGQPSDVADDSTYSVSGSYVSTAGAGSGAALAIGSSSSPGGLVVLNGNNTFAGGVTISNGATLEVFQDNNLGVDDPNNAVGSVYISNGELLTDATSTTAFVSNIQVGISGSGTLAAATNTTATFNGRVTGPMDTLTIGDGTNKGTVILTDSNNDIGGLMINGGTLEGTNWFAMVGVGINITLSNGGTFLTDFDGYNNGSGEFYGNNPLNITNSGSLETAAGTTATYSGITGGALGIGSATNTGDIVMSGANFYTGGTTVNGGTLLVHGDSGLGAASGGLALTGGQLELDFSGTMTRNVVVNGGTLAVTSGNTATFGGTTSVSGSLVVGDGTAGNDGALILTGSFANTGEIHVNDATLQVSGDLSNSGTLYLSNGAKFVTASTGTFSQKVFSSDNETISATAGTTMTYGNQIENFGTLTIGDGTNTGIVAFTANNIFINDVMVNTGATLEVSDDQNLGAVYLGVTLSGGAELLGNSGFSTTREIDFTSTGTLAAMNGTTATYGGTITGTFSVGDSIHQGTVVITSDYSDNVAVNGGAFQVNSSLTGSVTVNSGGTVGGHGTIHGKITVASGGSTYPGDPQILTAGSAEYMSGSTAQFSIATTGSSPHPPTAGTDYDQLSLTGSGQALTIDSGTTTLQLNLSSATLAVLQNNANNNILDNYFLFTLSNGTSSGMFSDLTLSIDGTSYTAAITDGEADLFNLGFDVSYTADSTTNTLTGGHDVAVEVIEVVPEPSTYLLMALGLGILLLFFRPSVKRRS